MFVDASALVAILTRDPEVDILLLAIEQAAARITSPIAIYETVLAIARKGSSLPDAQADVAAFLQAADIRIVPVTGVDALAAIDAFSRFGKGRGHPAQLNLGDCFAYASAKAAGCSLLFKGNDFSRTDIPSAIATH